MRLLALVDLVRDARLAEVNRKAAMVAETRAQLAALDAPQSTAGEIDPIAHAAAALRHGVWAEARRAEINRGLAMHTAALIEAREDAKVAFGRAAALRAILERKRR